MFLDFLGDVEIETVDRYNIYFTQLKHKKKLLTYFSLY